jgi:hypothetical protein
MTTPTSRLDEMLDRFYAAFGVLPERVRMGAGRYDELRAFLADNAIQSSYPMGTYVPTDCGIVWQYAEERMRVVKDEALEPDEVRLEAGESNGVAS